MDNFRCTNCNFNENKCQNDGLVTETWREQKRVEDSVEKCYKFFKNLLDIDSDIPELHRHRHESFLRKGLERLSQSYECLDSSRPWLCYWILHSMHLLNIPVSDKLSSSIAQFLARCQDRDGGFAGGPGQKAHLAPTYAAVNALCTLGVEEAFKVIDRPALQRFLCLMHQPDGSFTMHLGGEVDIRGTYCAASAARLTNIICPEMFDGTGEWIVRCQTYEGGFGGCPSMEAHGGYAFCALAALILINKTSLCDLNSLLRWITNRQMPYEGGFQGRTNKLVDGCYSFWQGGAFPLLHMVLAKQEENLVSPDRWMFHQEALQEYIMICCQHPLGGLLDKPEKPRDYYHTCYCLSGLSVAQHFAEGRLCEEYIMGSPINQLKMVHPVFNIGIDAVQATQKYFSQLLTPSQNDSNSENGTENTTESSTCAV